MTFKLYDLATEENDSLQLSALANQILTNRVKEDRQIYEDFLDRLGLMKYYDKLWDIGIDSLEGLSRVTVEDFNHMFIPAGIQIKIQRELRKAGHGAANVMKDASMGTEETDTDTSPSKVSDAQAKPKAKPVLNFGIKMKKSSQPAQATMCSMAIETDPVDDADIPLNVDEDHRAQRNIYEIPEKNLSQLIEAKKKTATQGTSPREESVVSTPTETQEVRPSLPFSFAALGSSEWTNCLGLQKTNSGQEQNIYSNKNRYLKDSSVGTNPPELKVTNRVACYGCFRQVQPEDTIDHKHLPNKVFCSEKCLKIEIDLILATCEVCFKLFEKPKGVPCKESGKWVCSETCRSKVQPQRSDTDLIEEQLEAKRKKEAELEYQRHHTSGGRDIDLDFEYNYN